MDLFLKRKEFRKDGIFSELFDSNHVLIACTLEHAFTITHGEFFSPIIPNGEFVCVRGNHKLHGMIESFSTFEITGIVNHSNLLFHWGNYNKDSEGCILLGSRFSFNGSEEMIINSKLTFNNFLSIQENLDSFKLTVS